MPHKLLLVLLSLFLCGPTLRAQLPTVFPKREARAVWVTTLGGLDWPKAKASTPAGREAQKAELCALLDQLQGIHINTVFLQTRVRGSVIYPSQTEPWDVALTGQYGASPGYDPLQFAIEECHRRGMELHAWVVTIPAYKVAQGRQMGARGVARTHPALCKKHNGQFYLDPGCPGTADYLTDICREIVDNYDVDGIHFDYIRYPENAVSFPDADTYRKYGNRQNKTQWRRDNVTRIVRQIYTAVKARKPWVKVSSSPVGKFKDGTRYSSKGWNCYDAVYQDAQGWLSEGIHDALYPMMYFQGDHFFPFAADWKEHDCRRFVAPGLGIYFLAPQEKDWPLSVITNQLHYIRQQGLGGQAYFRSKFLTDDTKGLYTYLQKEFYAYPALTPACTWIDSLPPTRPNGLRIEALGEGMERLSWAPSRDNLQEAGVRYNVYALWDGTPWQGTDASLFLSAENLVASYLSATSYAFNGMQARLYGLTLAVTAIDRCGNESSPSFYSFSVSQTDASDHRLLRLSGGLLELPPSEARFYVVTDLQGRILCTGAYANRVDVSHLPRGMYRVRTLQKKGISHLVGEFLK